MGQLTDMMNRRLEEYKQAIQTQQANQQKGKSTELPGVYVPRKDFGDMTQEEYEENINGTSK